VPKWARFLCEALKGQIFYVGSVSTDMSDDVGERQHESLERWRELLKLEMRRRGVFEDKLLFVNAANLTGFWWCARKSLLQSREDELAFFTSYVLQGAEVGASSSIEGCDPLELLRHVERVYKTHDPDEVLRRAACVGPEHVGWET
jgi:hypothetical protein